MRGTAVIIIAALSLACMRTGAMSGAHSNGVSPEELASVEAFLTSRYPVAKQLGRRKYEFEGSKTYFVPGWTTVAPAATGVLDTYLHDLRIYRSSLYWSHWAPEEISVLVALSDGRPTGAMTMSPDFAAPDDEFLQALAGSYVPGDGDRSAFVSGLAELVAAISHSGEIREGSCDGDCCSVELWEAPGREPRPWYRFDVCFDGDAVSLARAAWMRAPSN